MKARRNANESAAIATLKNISSAQAQIQASGVIDRNGNGAGEYGWFGEMAGVSDITLPDGKTVRVTPPVLSSRFGTVEQGRVTRSGYHFQLFLPGNASQPVADGLPDAGQAEVLWCCYAWPTVHENSEQTSELSPLHRARRGPMLGGMRRARGRGQARTGSSVLGRRPRIFATTNAMSFS